MGFKENITISNSSSAVVSAYVSASLIMKTGSLITRLSHSFKKEALKFCLESRSKYSIIRFQMLRKTAMINFNQTSSARKTATFIHLVV
jgi:hypothetical protein